MSFNVPPASASASFHVASRNTASGSAGSMTKSADFGTPDLRMTAAKCVADDIVDLFLAAGAHAARALDAGVEVDRHRRMREVRCRLRACFKARLADAEPSLPLFQLRVRPVHPRRHVGSEHLH